VIVSWLAARKYGVLSGVANAGRGIVMRKMNADFVELPYSGLGKMQSSVLIAVENNIIVISGGSKFVRISALV